MRLLALLLLLPGSVWGQGVKLPAEIKGAVGAWIIVAPESVDGGTPKWRIDPGLQEVRLDLLLPPAVLDQLKGKVLTALVPGRYKIEAWNAKGDVASDIATCIVVIGNPPPGPNPPPEPPGPEPPPNPPEAGSRTVMIFHESGQQTPGQGLLFNQLRSGQAAAYLKDRKHRLYILDDDSVGSDGKPALDAWKKHFANTSLPAMVIADKDGKVLLATPLPGTADDVLTLLKAHGG